VNHTSIIILHFLSILSFNSHGCHAAAITISASLVYLDKFIVLLLQLITVAHTFISKAVIGFQTILLLPITHTTFQTKSINSDLKISIIHAGVHGINHELSHIRIFH
jgi:hypothetical protein